MPDDAAVERPTANLILIGVTSIISLAMMGGVQAESQAALSLALMRGESTISQLLTHAFLHTDVMHLLSNMLCVYAFGNAINIKLGHARYVGLYLLFSACAALAWLFLGNGGGAVGASGAVMGLAGYFLIVFPRTRVRLLVPALALLIIVVSLVLEVVRLHETLVAPLSILALLIGWVVHALRVSDPEEGRILRFLGFFTLHLAGVWVVLILIGQDVWAVARAQTDGIAHWAHLGGAAAGLGVALFMTGLGLTRGCAEQPTLLELAGWRERVAPVRPVPTWRPRLRPDPAQPSFEEWRETRLASRGRPAERRLRPPAPPLPVRRRAG